MYRLLDSSSLCQMCISPTCGRIRSNTHVCNHEDTAQCSLHALHPAPGSLLNIRITNVHRHTQPFVLNVTLLAQTQVFRPTQQELHWLAILPSPLFCCCYFLFFERKPHFVEQAGLELTAILFLNLLSHLVQQHFFLNYW